jgi:SAM-dependent methyltransferase
MLLFQRYATPHFRSGDRVLELGVDADPSAYRKALGNLDLRWETADLAPEVMAGIPSGTTFAPATAAQYLMPSEYEIPVQDNVFDVVVAGQVGEHVRRIWAWVAELSRVLVAGGKLVLITPISWPYHEAPVDCWRIYPEGMRALCAEAKLDVLVCEMHALEPKASRNQYFGASFLPGPPTPKTVAKRIFRTVTGYPAATSLDLVTIAQKQ